MNNKILTFVIITLCLLHIAPLGVHCRRTKQTEQLTNIDVRDKILQLQCYAKCKDTISNADCRKTCQTDMIKAPKPGYCPDKKNAIFKNINFKPPQNLSCLDNCSYDFDCPEVGKCCNSECGPVCMEPIGVRDLLPPIPKISKYLVIRREQKVEITIQSNSSYYFHVEMRYHIGSLLSTRKLGSWQYQPVEKLAEMKIDSTSKL